MLVTLQEAQKIEECFVYDRKTAERYIIFFDDIEKDYEEHKDAYVNYKEKDGNVGGGRSGVSNPTEQKALKGLRYDEITDTAKWLKAVTICRHTLSERKNIFISCRIQAQKQAVHNGQRGRKAWVAYTQYKYTEKIEERFLTTESINDATVRRWWKEIIDNVVYIANKL